MSIQEQIHESMSLWLSSRLGQEVTVYDYEESTAYEGYCETCYYEYVVVGMNYRTSTGDESVYTYSGSLSELVRELT